MAMLLRRERPGKSAKARPTHPFPPVLNVEVTNDCNLECPMCARTTSMSRPVKHMTDDMFRRVVDEADTHGVAKFRLYMFGESLLHPRIYDYIRYAATKKGIHRIELSTNVTTLTEENSRKLIESGLGHLILSVDAQSKEVYEVVRGFDFDRVLANARRFLELHREMHATMSVNVSIISMGIKQDEIEKFREEWEGYRNDRVKILVKKLINFGGLVDTTQFVGNAEAAPVGDGRRKSCQKLWDSLTVQSNGEIVACCYDVNGSMPYGNARDVGLMDAWQGAAIRAMREQHLALDFSRLPLCGACDGTLRKPQAAPAE